MSDSLSRVLQLAQAAALLDAADAASTDGLATAAEVIYDLRARAAELRGDEAKYENSGWSEAKTPATWREYARLALIAGMPYVDVDSDEYWDSLPTLGASEA